MNEQAFLILEDGSIYQGVALGTKGLAIGEVVFNTSMTGYPEMLTDPSYAGQIVVPTYPLIGNYGISSRYFESNKIQVAGFVVRDHCFQPSHNSSEFSVNEFLSSQGIPGISGVDTRSITRKLRTRGVMMGAITTRHDHAAILKDLRKAPKYDSINYADKVGTENKYGWPKQNTPKYRIFVSDYGLKYNILRILANKECEVVVFPGTTAATDILSESPDGVILSPGPGDPELLDYAVTIARGLIGRVPLMGICLGHQIIGRALGAKTFKLKFGHRGGNHPVRDLKTGLVHITSQNHGYAVDPDSLSSEVEISHVNLNDNTVEGLRHKSMPLMSIQYHSEGSPGPHDNEYLFDSFIKIVEELK